MACVKYTYIKYTYIKCHVTSIYMYISRFVSNITNTIVIDESRKSAKKISKYLKYNTRNIQTLSSWNTFTRLCFDKYGRKR